MNKLFLSGFFAITLLSANHLQAFNPEYKLAKQEFKAQAEAVYKNKLAHSLDKSTDLIKKAKAGDREKQQQLVLINALRELIPIGSITDTSLLTQQWALVSLRLETYFNELNFSSDESVRYKHPIASVSQLVKKALDIFDLAGKENIKAPGDEKRFLTHLADFICSSGGYSNSQGLFVKNRTKWEEVRDPSSILSNFIARVVFNRFDEPISTQGGAASTAIVESANFDDDVD